MRAFSKIYQESLFHEYKVESNANDEIYLEMKVEDLLLAMRSSNNASAVVMRMTGRSADAFLTFTITTEVNSGQHTVFFLMDRRLANNSLNIGSPWELASDHTKCADRKDNDCRWSEQHCCIYRAYDTHP